MLGFGKAGKYSPKHSILSRFTPLHKFWGTKKDAIKAQEIHDRWEYILGGNFNHDRTK